MLRLLSVFTCCAAIIPSIQVSGQVSLDMESVNADSHISAITLFKGRASITRTTSLDLTTGGYSVFFNDLPANAALNSVQAHVIGDSALLGVDTIEIPVAKSNVEILKEINAEIEDLESVLDELNAREDAINVQKELLQTLIEQSNNAKDSSVDLEAMEAQLQFIGRKMTEFSTALKGNEKEVDSINGELSALKSKRNSIARDNRIQHNAVVDIGVRQSGNVTVELTYLVSNASWSPTYSIRSHPASNIITIDYDAEISQHTGEDWTDVSITLSTAKPQQYTKPPLPSPWYVDIYEPIVLGTIAETSAPRTRRSVGNSFDASESMQADRAVDMASMAATVVGDGPVVNFLLPRTLVVPSNSKEHQTTSIASIEVESELFRIAVPMNTEDVFIRSDVTNTSPYILLGGVASIFHGSDYIGKTTLSTVTPQETFPLDLGIDPSVTATRTLQEKNTSSTGLFASGKQTMFDYRIEISNGHDEPIDLRVWDRIPVSQNEQIEISLKGLSSPLSTNAIYVETDRPLGLLRWDLNVLANRTGDKKDSITWKVEVARGKDIEHTPLPD